MTARGNRILPADVARCADGINCPERKVCDRWVLRVNPRGWETASQWCNFFKHYGDHGCKHKIARPQ